MQPHSRLSGTIQSRVRGRLSLLTAVLFAFAFLVVAPAPAANASPTHAGVKPRVIVTTDPEKDDQNSFIRYLLYSDWFTTEGLVVTSSQYHWAGDGKGTKQWIAGREYTRLPKGDPCPCTSWRWPAGPNHVQLGLAAYAKVYANLHSHDANYPTPQQLAATYRVGNIDFDGEMSHDTPGSNLIKQKLLDSNPQPVFLLAWGGMNTIARALESIELQYSHTAQWRSIYQRVSRKAIILASGDQDGTGASYVTPHWPLVRTIGMTAAIGSVIDSTGSLSYGAQLTASAANKVYYTPAWVRANITSKGPLGALYYTWGDGRQMVKGDLTDFMWLSGYTKAQLTALGYFAWLDPQAKGSFLGEGDTYTFLNLLGNGLRSFQDTSWGSYSSGADLPYTMNEEAVRLAWSVTPARGAVEHAPLVWVRGPLSRTARPGQTVTLTAVSKDPDPGQRVTLSWREDTTVDTYPGTVTLKTSGSTVRFTVPTDAKRGQTIHILVQAVDNAPTPLARYQRIVITVR